MLKQDYRDLELIVVDDASPDGTEQVVQSFNDPRVVYLRHESNRGASAARNSGIARSRGEWVVFLDDDDELLPSSLRRIAGYLSRAPRGLAFTWGGIERWNSRSAATERRTTPPIPCSHLGAATGQALTVRRDALTAVGGFDESLPAVEDFDLLIRLGQRFVGAPVHDVLVRVHLHSHGQLTDPSPAKVTAYLRFEEKHQEYLSSYPSVGVPFWTKSARIAYAVGDRRSGRRMALRALRHDPFSWRRWKTVICLELFGTEDLGIRRRLGL